MKHNDIEEHLYSSNNQKDEITLCPYCKSNQIHPDTGFCFTCKSDTRGEKLTHQIAIKIKEKDENR